jgi:hypothetical protein
LVADEGRRERAEQRRRSATLHRARLQPAELDLDPVRGAAAVSLVAALTRESWAQSGLPLPSYGRAETPVRFVPGRLT